MDDVNGHSPVELFWRSTSQMRWDPTLANRPFIRRAGPSVNGLSVRSDLIGIFLKSHLALVPPGDIIRPDRTCRAKPTPLEQAMDHAASGIAGANADRAPAAHIA